ncbi:CHASE domain-containing protein, partial [Streptococcus pneumoniae]|uniref:CHASE domain-containing protein n=1 Tax=Streptococcus pneumoniae TaxID=1313 RepID=UPI0013DCA5C1
ASARTRLFQTDDGNRQSGVLVAIPVFAKGTSRETTADRRRNLAGFVIGIFDLPMLVQSIRVTTGASPAVSVN